MEADWENDWRALYAAVSAGDSGQVASLCQPAALNNIFVLVDDGGYVPYIDQPIKWSFWKDTYPTVLFYALPHPDIMGLLLQYGADPSIRNLRGETVFDILVSRIAMDVAWSEWDHASDLECLEVLLSFGFRATLVNLEEGLALRDCPVPCASWRPRLNRILDACIPRHQVPSLYGICLRKVRACLRDLPGDVASLGLPMTVVNDLREVGLEGPK